MQLKCKCGQPTEFGTLCPACRAAVVELQAQTSRRIDRRHKRHVWVSEMEKVIPPHYLKRHVHIRQLPFRFVAQFKYRSSCGVVMSGATGVGKTHALLAMARQAIIDGKSVQRRRYARLFGDIRATYKRRDADQQAVIDSFCAPDVLIVDDLASRAVSGGKKESDFCIEKFYEILDERIEQDRETWITVNLPKADIATAMGDPVSSRLELLTWIVATGDDKRKHNT